MASVFNSSKGCDGVATADDNVNEDPTVVEAQMISNNFVSSTECAYNNYASLAQNLSWADRFYEKEPDIVAVFDFDLRTIIRYQMSKLYKTVPVSVALIALAALSTATEIDVLYSYVFMFLLLALLSFNFLFALQQYKSQANHGIHLAVTTNCIRYDQESPKVHTVVRIIHWIDLWESQSRIASPCCRLLTIISRITDSTLSHYHL
jgi:hypothetical protein